MFFGVNGCFRILSDQFHDMFQSGFSGLHVPVALEQVENDFFHGMSF